MKRIFLALLLTTSVVAAAPTAVRAAREPSADERAAIAATDTRAPECVTVTVSTADAGWALIADAESDTCWSEGRLAVVKRSGGGWTTWRTGEELPDVTCRSISVPEAVGLDLGACEAAPVRRATERELAGMRRGAARRPIGRRCVRYARVSALRPRYGLIAIDPVRGCSPAAWTNGALLVMSRPTETSARWRVALDASQGVSCDTLAIPPDLLGTLIDCQPTPPPPRPFMSGYEAKRALSRWLFREGAEVVWHYGCDRSGRVGVFCAVGYWRYGDCNRATADVTKKGGRIHIEMTTSWSRPMSIDSCDSAI